MTASYSFGHTALIHDIWLSSTPNKCSIVHTGRSLQELRPRQFTSNARFHHRGIYGRLFEVVADDV